VHWAISQRKMDGFKSTIKNATNATNVTSSQKSIVSEDGENNFNATNATAEGGINGINNLNDTAVNPHQLELDGIYGISGVSSEEEWELNPSERMDEVEI